MAEYVIFTDSASDLPASVADGLGVRVIPLEVNMEGELKLNNEIDVNHTLIEYCEGKGRGNVWR